MRHLGPVLEAPDLAVGTVADGQLYQRTAGGTTGTSGGGGGGDLAVVTHGSNANESRPVAPIVYWIGSVAPANRQTGDLWLEVP